MAMLWRCCDVHISCASSISVPAPVALKKHAGTRGKGRARCGQSGRETASGQEGHARHQAPADRGCHRGGGLAGQRARDQKNLARRPVCAGPTQEGMCHPENNPLVKGTNVSSICLASRRCFFPNALFLRLPNTP